MQLPGGTVVKNLLANAGSLGQEDPLEKKMATHSSILAWKIPGTEEPGGPQSMGSKRVRHDLAHTHTHTHLKSIKLLGKTVVTFG